MLVDLQSVWMGLNVLFILLLYSTSEIACFLVGITCSKLTIETLEDVKYVQS